jgi:hypothetical protein
VGGGRGGEIRRVGQFQHQLPRLLHAGHQVRNPLHSLNIVGGFFLIYYGWSRWMQLE